MSVRHASMALAALLALGCGSEDKSTVLTQSLSQCSPDDSGMKQLFASSCSQAGCHSDVDKAAALSLTEDRYFASLVGVESGSCEGWTRVVPGAPEASLLWRKLYSEAPPCGDPMPVGTHLSAVELSCVRGWIEALEPVTPVVGCESCGGDICVDLSRDPNHCGGCDAACPAGSECTDGTCACAGELSFCDDRCVDTTASASHCGACGNVCGQGALCNVGECLCGGGLVRCGTECVDVASDATNCGACATSCAAGQVCLEGACADGCGVLTQCGSSCADTSSSALHCGACDTRCSSGSSCISSSCECPGGMADCGGACFDVLFDPLNCGACGAACPAGLSCDAGRCACPGGGTACGAICTDTQTDELNCGGCGISCGASQSCQAGQCTCTGSGSVSFSRDILPIFGAECALAGCHGGLRARANLDLSAGSAYAALVGVPADQCGRQRVVPGDPASSYLMNKLLGVNMCSGTQMPKAGSGLPAQQLDAIGAWICAGAAND